MRRVFGGIVALSLSLGIAGQAKAEFTFTTLDVPGAIQTTRANGINDAGQIVGLYVDAGGRGHGFLTTAVPEPSTLVMGGTAALIGLGYWWRRSRHAVA